MASLIDDRDVAGILRRDWLDDLYRTIEGFLSHVTIFNLSL